MSDRIKCIRCGADSYNVYDRTSLAAEIMERNKELAELKAENIKIRSMLGDEFDDVACDKILANTEELTKENTELKDILDSLVDIQNGPPLIRDTEEWTEIMYKANRALGR